MGNTRSEKEIQEWLLKNVSQMLGKKAEEIEINKDLQNYGLSSMAAVGLSGELEDWLGRKLNPSLVLQQRTIASIARYLVESGK